MSCNYVVHGITNLLDNERNRMKFNKEDQRYLAERKQLSQQSGPREIWSVVDHWPLYVGVRNLARYIAISDLLRSTMQVPGHIAEFGSWRGANLMFMTKLLKISDPLSNKVVHCFDSFEGLSTFTAEDGAAETMHGAYKGTLEELTDYMRLYGLEDDIVIHKGLIQDTLPAALQEDAGLSFSFVYCDTDLFEPTKLILESLHDRLSKGGLFVIDEWNFEQWPGETVAVRDFLKEYDSCYEVLHVPHTSQPSLALRKIAY